MSARAESLPIALKPETPLRRLASDFFASRVAAAAFFAFSLIVFMALFAPWLAPQNPYDLMQLDIDAVEAYGKALENIDDPTVHKKISEFRGDHERHIGRRGAARLAGSRHRDRIGDDTAVFPGPAAVAIRRKHIGRTCEESGKQRDLSRATSSSGCPRGRPGSRW